MTKLNKRCGLFIIYVDHYKTVDDMSNPGLCSESALSSIVLSACTRSEKHLSIPLLREYKVLYTGFPVFHTADFSVSVQSELEGFFFVFPNSAVYYTNAESWAFCNH